MSLRHCVAVDLGASSGRVMLASYQPGQQTLALREIHRFTNSLQKVDGFDCWDLDSLEGEIRRGLEKVCERGILIDSIGIDTWAARKSIAAAAFSFCRLTPFISCARWLNSSRSWSARPRTRC